MKFLMDDSLGLGFLKMSLVIVYHKNCCLVCIVIGGRFLGGHPVFKSTIKWPFKRNVPGPGHGHIFALDTNPKSRHESSKKITDPLLKSKGNNPIHHRRGKYYFENYKEPSTDSIRDYMSLIVCILLCLFIRYLNTLLGFYTLH